MQVQIHKDNVRFRPRPARMTELMFGKPKSRSWHVSQSSSVYPRCKPQAKACRVRDLEVRDLKSCTQSLCCTPGAVIAVKWSAMFTAAWVSDISAEPNTNRNLQKLVERAAGRHSWRNIHGCAN